ncbi:MAG: precorrin-8X methylmutase [Proteobacteria bacterium]|nr:MAG: precorrin-8X methylmutase [Pseudomonadota bacterium]
MNKYIQDPTRIEQESFWQIRELLELDHLSPAEQQVALRMVHSCGVPELFQHIRFSADACAAGLAALAQSASMLCDVEMVKHGITKRMVQSEPLCFLNTPRTIALARQHGETRSMAALDLWHKHLAGSIVLIANAPTALFRLLEMLAQGVPKPALIIGIPVGFVGAAESKQALWDQHQALDVECITVLGRQGGSAITASVLNALLRYQRGECY